MLLAVNRVPKFVLYLTDGWVGVERFLFGGHGRLLHRRLLGGGPKLDTILFKDCFQKVEASWFLDNVFVCVALKLLTLTGNALKRRKFLETLPDSISTYEP